MHISEGVLSGPVLAAGWAVTAAGTAAGLARIDYDRLICVALLASAFFVATLVHVPLGPASAHLVLNGLLGVLLGLGAFPAILVGLTLQAVLFGYGGLTVLGVNAANMALPAVLLGLAARPFLGARPGVRGTASVLAGAGAVLGAGLLTAASLAFTDEGFTAAARLLVLAHLPVMAVEGAVTLFAVGFLVRVRPELVFGAAPGVTTPPQDADRHEPRGPTP
jgi:cobalt/nickel transport system permease protein